MPTTKAQRVRTDGAESAPAEETSRRADALFRAALECCRQHHRYAKLVAMDSPDDEQTAACRLVELADTLLAEAVEAYQLAATRPEADGDHAWWHLANALWHSSREYARRHSVSERAARARRAGGETLSELTLDFDLEASALLLLQQALDAYRRCRPSAAV